MAEERLGRLAAGVRDVEMGLWAQIRALQLRLADAEARAWHGSAGTSGHDLT